MRNKLFVATLLVLVASCGRAGDDDDTSFHVPSPHGFPSPTASAEASPTPDCTPEATPSPEPTTEPTRACSEDKVLLCHVPRGNPENANWLCVAPQGADAHLEHHEGDYLQGTEVGQCDSN